MNSHLGFTNKSIHKPDKVSPIPMMSDTEETDNFEEIAKYTDLNARHDMLVSGWDDTDDLIEEDDDPHANPKKELLWAASENKFDLVKTILAKYPEYINAVDADGYSPLHKACYNDNVEMVKFLLKLGADPNLKTEYGWTPLHSACKWNNGKSAAILLQHGCDINATSDGNQTALHIAATVSNCRESAVTLLMDRKIQAQKLNNSKDTAAEIARRTGLSLPIFDMGHSAFEYQETGVLEL